MSLVLLVTQLVCGFTVVSAPPTNDPATWAAAGLTITYPSVGPRTITDGSDKTAIASAFAAWNHVSCSTFRFTDGGVSDSASTNNIEYVTNSSDFSNPEVLAYTVRNRTGDHWVGVNVRFNDFSSNIGWSTDGKIWVAPDNTLPAYDFQSTVTHELGHVLGLGHSADPEATMYFAGRQGRTYFRTLSADDVAGVCFLYPASQTACVTDDDCPLQDATQGGAAKVTVCNSGTCVIAKRGYGEDCFANGDCTSGVCARFDDDTALTDPGQCSKDCTSSACPNGDVCNSVHQCAPRAADCAPGCGGDSACLPDVDGDFTCTLHCVLPAHACTDPKAVCFNGASDSNPGLCRVPGPRKTGLLCDAPGECASLICTSGTDGRQTCVGTELAPPTITEDPPPPDDGGPLSDGGGSGGDGSGDFADQGDGPLNDGGDIEKSHGGCAEVGPSFLMVAFAVVLTLRLRRKLV